VTDTAAQRRKAVALGAEAEHKVAQALQSDGWCVRSRNWRGGGGELDLVAEKAGCIRFVEVKARSSGGISGLESVGLAKQRKLSRAAEAWLCEWSGPFVEASFTVVLVEGDVFHWIDNAFDGA